MVALNSVPYSESSTSSSKFVNHRRDGGVPGARKSRMLSVFFTPAQLLSDAFLVPEAIQSLTASRDDDDDDDDDDKKGDGGEEVALNSSFAPTKPASLHSSSWQEKHALYAPCSNRR